MSHLVLDTGALVAYVRGRGLVGSLVAEANDTGVRVTVPAVCLAEAHSVVHYEEYPYLDVLCNLPPVTVEPLQHGDCPVVGYLGWRTGRLGLGQAALMTISEDALLLTDDPGRARSIIPDDWRVEQV